MEHSFIYTAVPRRSLFAPSELRSGTIRSVTIDDLTRRAARINVTLTVHETRNDFLASITRTSPASALSLNDLAAAAAAGTFLYHDAPAALRRLHRDIDAAFDTPRFHIKRSPDEALFLPFGRWEWQPPSRHDDMTLRARYVIERQPEPPLTQLAQFIRYNRVYARALVTITYDPGTERTRTSEVCSSPDFLSNRK